MGQTSDTFLDGGEFCEAPPSPSTSIKRRSKLELELTEEVIAELRVELHGNLMLAMQAITRFHEIDPEENVPSTAWSQEFGIENAKKMHKLAQMVHMDTRSAPIAVKIISDMYKATESARASKDGGSVNNYNFMVVMDASGAKEAPEEIIIDDTGSE